MVVNFVVVVVVVGVALAPADEDCSGHDLLRLSRDYGCTRRAACLRHPPPDLFGAKAFDRATAGCGGRVTISVPTREGWS